MKSFFLQKWILKKMKYHLEWLVFFSGQYKSHQCSISWVGVILYRADWKLIKRFSVNYFAYISVKMWWAIHSSEKKKGDGDGERDWIISKWNALNVIGWHFHFSRLNKLKISWHLILWLKTFEIGLFSFVWLFIYLVLCTLARCWVYFSLFPFLFSQRAIFYFYIKCGFVAENRMPNIFLG